MDRERKDELPQMQVGFIDVICLPLYRVLSETFPWVKPLYQETLENRKHWQDLAEKVEMGLTWIDHDTIDKPVEAFASKRRHLVGIKRTRCWGYLVREGQTLFFAGGVREWTHLV